jgi:hypothetical protein
MSDQPIGPTYPKLRKTYLVGNGLAFVILLLAGLINLVVGPRNLGIFLFALFQLVFASTTLLFMDSESRKSDPQPPSFFKWRESWTRELAVNRRRVAITFLCVTPAFFLFASIVVFYGAVTGTISPH